MLHTTPIPSSTPSARGLTNDQMIRRVLNKVHYLNAFLYDDQMTSSPKTIDEVYD